MIGAADDYGLGACSTAAAGGGRELFCGMLEVLREEAGGGEKVANRGSRS